MDRDKHHVKHSHDKRRHEVHSKAKKRPLGRVVFVALVFFVLVVVVSGLIYLMTRSGETRLSNQKDVAAVVNGEDIKLSYLNDQYDRIPENYKPFITKSVLLNQTINEVLLLQEAKKQGIVVTKDDVKKEIETAMSAAGVSDEDMDQRLNEQNLTMDFVEDLYMKQLTINQLLEKMVFPKISVSEQEIVGFYDSRIRAMHILVESEDEAEDLISDLKKVSAKDLKSRFAELAVEKSTDPSAKVNEGDLGEFGQGQMVPSFEEAAFALKENTFSQKPVQSQFGYHVILRLPKVESLADQHDAIADMILNQKKAQAVPLYLEQLESKADIKILYVE